MPRHTHDVERAEREERILRSRNFHKGRFRNRIKTTVLVPGRGLEVAKDWLTTRGPRRPPAPLPSVRVTRHSFASPPRDDIRVCWLGHSTVLLEVEGLRLLFDPIWARRSSPSRLAGPLRFQPCPLPLEELPELTAVVVSHDHYDHLDRGVVRFLARRDPHLPWLTPLGVGAHLEKWGVAPACIRELDWGEEVSPAEGRLRLVAAPARHFSGRGLLDRNRTQWCSWAVLGRRHSVYFGGDGGYHPGFAEIGRQLGPFDLALLEIGAFHPNWGQVHLGPENALRACRELGGRRLLPIHWGTFNLAIHPWDEPIETLVARAPQAGVELLVPRFGEVVRLRDAPPVTAWWRSKP
jgi:L-ascorbate metabolism protein UlaG (beta-lactamase superfamily)